MAVDLNAYAWYCDECDSCLNEQSGFYADCGSWTCTNCGYSNSIDIYSVLDDDEIAEFEASGYGSYNEFIENRDCGESLSVWDAACIWASNGKDEDYMFGYTEEELEDAL